MWVVDSGGAQGMLPLTPCRTHGSCASDGTKTLSAKSWLRSRKCVDMKALADETKSWLLTGLTFLPRSQKTA